MLELMARGGMRVDEVLKLNVADVDDQKLTIRNPKSGKNSEAVFIPKKLADRLKDYIRARGMEDSQRVFPISYTAARVMVRKAGTLVGVHLRPHDLRRHAATYASRSWGCPWRSSARSSCGTPISPPRKGIWGRSAMWKQ
jgi:integrase/recombinase XerD